MTEATRPAPDRDLVPRPRPAAGRRETSLTPAVPRAAGTERAGVVLARTGAGELLALQGTAGNRAVARLVAGAVVQRHPEPTTNAEAEQATASGGGTSTEAGTGAAETTEAAEATEAEAAESGATSQPGTGTTGPAGTGLTGDVRKKAIEDACRASNTGTWAMAIIEKWKVPVDYEYGGQGSFHRGGSIYINKTLGVGAAAITLMHEAQHADTYKSGKQADRTKLGRAEYIKQSIADEAEAVVRQIEGLAVTTGLGIDMTGVSIGDDLKQRYLTAFYKKRDELKAANPAMSTAEINRICRQTTRDGEVTKWFYDGTFVTSTDNNPYDVFYGLQWDEVNKAPGKT